MRLQTRISRAAMSLTEIVVVMAIIMVLAGLSFYAFSAAKGFADKMEGDTRLAIGHVSRHGKLNAKASQAVTLATNPNPRPDRYPGHYFVTLTSTVTNPQAEAQRLAGVVSGNVVGVYTRGIYGCGLACPDANAPLLASDPAVQAYEQAHSIYMAQGTFNTLNVQRTFSNGISGMTATTPVAKMYAAPPSIFRMYRNDNIQGIVTSRVNLTGTSTAGVVVAVMDTGIDWTHPDLNVFYAQDFTGGNNAMDTNGHGTHIAGVIGAVDKIAVQGTLGIYPGAPLMSLKVADPGPAGGAGGWGQNVTTGGSSLFVYAALEYVIANASKIGVCNMSFFTTSADTTMNTLVNAAADAGVIMVASCGGHNGGGGGGGGIDLSITPVSPGMARGAIAICSITDTDGQPGGFGVAGDDQYSTTASQNFGGTYIAFAANGGSARLPAGGYAIYSTIPLAGQAANGLAAPYSGYVNGNSVAGGTNLAEGTSFAAANVSGMMALLKDPQTNLGFVLGAGRGVTTYHLQMNTRDQAVAALFNATHQTTPFQMINPLTGSAWQIVGAHRIVTRYTKSLYGDYVSDPVTGRRIPIATFYTNPNAAPAFLPPFPG